jgi:hypothetical protein
MCGVSSAANTECLCLMAESCEDGNKYNWFTNIFDQIQVHLALLSQFILKGKGKAVPVLNSSSYMALQAMSGLGLLL